MVTRSSLGFLHAYISSITERSMWSEISPIHALPSSVFSPSKIILCEAVFYYLLRLRCHHWLKTFALSISHIILQSLLCYTISKTFKLTILTLYYIYRLSNSWNLKVIITLEGNNYIHICTPSLHEETFIVCLWYISI